MWRAGLAMAWLFVGCPQPQSPDRGEPAGDEAATPKPALDNLDLPDEAQPVPSATGPAIPDHAGDRPPELKVDMKTVTTWAPVKTWPGALSSNSAIPVRTALGPDGKPAVATDVQALAATMTRGFQLGQGKLLLGEPLVVSLRIEVAKGEWAEDMGGNYRGRGRDDNFAFVLERADGTLVPDIFEGPVFVGGGLGSSVAVRPGEAFVHHSAVQHYASITEPGSYKLHCVLFARGHSPLGWDEARAAHATAQLGKGTSYDAKKNLASAPDGKTYAVIPSMGGDFGKGPIELPKLLLDRMGDNVSQVSDYAVFDLELVEGSAAERKAMVSRWAKIAEGSRDMAWPRAIGDAAKEAVSYARQEDFVPTMKNWLETKPSSAPGLLQGLAMRDSAEAVKLVIKHGRAASWYGLGDLSDTAVRNNAAELVPLLGDADAGTRAAAFALLSRVAKDRFGAAWSGYDSERPTPAEAEVMLPKVRERFGLPAP